MNTSPRIHRGPAGAGMSRPMKPLRHMVFPAWLTWIITRRKTESELLKGYKINLGTCNHSSDNKVASSPLCQGKQKLYLFSFSFLKDATQSVLYRCCRSRLCGPLLDNKHHISPWGCTALRSESRTGRPRWRWWRAAMGSYHSSPCTETQPEATY